VKKVQLAKAAHHQRVCRPVPVRRAHGQPTSVRQPKRRRCSRLA
jgi:hypothetical protein